MSDAKDDPLLTPTQVAQELQVTRAAVYKWIAEGKLEALKAGKVTRIRRSALEKFLKPIQR